MRDLEPWERSKTVWQHAFFAVALGLGTLGALTGGRHDFAAIAIRLGLVAALAAWYGYWFGWATRRHRSGGSEAGRSHRGRVWDGPAGGVHLPYLIGVAVLWAVLTAVDPALLAVGVAALIPYCLRRPLWSAVAAAALAAVWIGPNLLDGTVSWPAVATCLLGVGTVVVIAGYITTLDREGRARQRLLDQLAAAQAELAATERTAGTLAERQRLARDIHDTLTQGFASIGMLLDAAQAQLNDEHPGAGHIDRALRLARENLAESRRLVWALRPVPLDGARLAEAVRALTDRLAEETGVRTTTLLTGTTATLPADAEAALLRVVQEALTNVRRHAAATTEVTITVSYMDDTVVIDVHDDGTGFTTEPLPAGIGLRAMRERVQELGGTLAIESAPGEGTTIAAAIPRTVHRPAAPQPGPPDRVADPEPATGYPDVSDATRTDAGAADTRRSDLPTHR